MMEDNVTGAAGRESSAEFPGARRTVETDAACTFAGRDGSKRNVERWPPHRIPALSVLFGATPRRHSQMDGGVIPMILR